MTDEVISIIVPVYNGEKYIRDTIISAQEQTYQNIEILIIDDGSTDKTNSIINVLAENDPRIKYIYQSNKGPAETKNLGIDLFNGEYAIFLDSDDLLEKNAVEKMLLSARTQHADLIIFSFDKFNDLYENMGSRNASSKKINKMFTAVWNKMYHKSILKRLRFPEKTIFEDVAFSAMATLLSKKMAIIPPEIYLYHYRQRAQSLTKKNFDVIQQLDIVTDFEEMFNFIKKNNIELSIEQVCEIDRLINTQIFSHSLLVAKADEKSIKKNMVIKKLIDFQKKKVKNIWSYDENLFLNSKQIFLMFLLKNNFLNLALSLAKVSNFVRGRKKLRG
ncbi:MAG: glycosyltransferase family 2 protein [Leuconostoc mesenteroides]|jgi:glycosyltransferase involved in cell wall biosynthesis|nr:glycosyltransferase family 2 protein [Leuconostoc mesenteroides]